jgi:hypothetical protein
MPVQLPTPIEPLSSPQPGLTAKHFLATRTVAFLDKGCWGPGVDLENEKRYVESRAGRFPESLSKLAYHWYQFQFALRLLRRCRSYDGVAVGRAMW